MSLIVLGKSGDDKGSQLEQLTKILLKHQGFTNVITNIQVGGGSELDVTAVKKAQAGIKDITIPVLCECKAHQTPIVLTDWLKFIGKLAIARKKHEYTIGLMVALGGANGAVMGSYNDVFGDDESVQLIANDDLFELLQQVFKLPSIDTIKGLLNSIPGLGVDDVDLVYYKKKVYWLVSLEGHHYTLCEASGNLAEKKSIRDIKPLLKGVTEYVEEDYVDVFEGFELQRRKDFLGVRVITELACKRLVNKKIVDAFANEIGTGTVEITTLLTSNQFIRYDNKLKRIILKEDAEIDFCDFYRFVLSMDTPVELIMSDYYQTHINRDLLNQIWEIQNSFHIEEDEVNGCLSILKLSPAALLYALYPDRILQGFKVMQRDSQMALMYQSHFKSELFKRFQSDFQNPQLSKLFLSQDIQKATIETRLTIARDMSGFSLESRLNYIWVNAKDIEQPVLVVAKEEQ